MFNFIRFREITGTACHARNINLIGQIILLILTVIAIYYGVTYGNEYTIVLAFSISYSILYFLYLIVSYKFALGNESV